MSRNNNPNTPLSLDTPIDEDRVRRALGLKTGTTHQQRPDQARQRHRFVADGAVPVVMLNRTDSETTGLREKVSALETTLEHERQAHAAVRRSLVEAQAANQALQTRLGHMDLAHGEALRTERDGRRAAEELIATLRAERAAEPPRKAARARPVESPVERPAEMKPELAADSSPSPAPEEAAPAPRAPRKPRAASQPKEPKPVRWWTPSFRAKKA